MKNVKENDLSEKIPTLCSQRWILAFMFSTGFFFVFAMRVNLSVALVCMVKTPMENVTKLSSVEHNLTSGLCGEHEEEALQPNQRGEFDWDKETRASILSAFFYGYILTQIPGGWLADRFGGRRVFGIAMAISAVSTLVLPACARLSVVMVYVLRIILGLAQGVVHPACYSMWGRWAPRLERTKLLSVSSAGAWVGIIATFASSGVLCEYGFDNGWGSIFYILGGLCCIWVILWFIQVRDTPTDHPRITKAERDHIERNIGFDSVKKTPNIPWKEMARSVPLWALITCHLCGNWADYTLMTCLPEFMKNVLQFNIKSNGALSSLPYICSASMTVVVGHLADTLRRMRILSTTQTRKVFQSVAFIGSAVFLVATGFVPCSVRELAVVFLCFAVLFTSFSGGGYGFNHIDIAARFAGTLIGITNTIATIPGILSPIVAGALTTNDTPEEWQNVFYVSAAFYIIGTIVFSAFASGETQPWAMDKDIELEIQVSSKLLSPTDESKTSMTTSE